MAEARLISLAHEVIDENADRIERADQSGVPVQIIIDWHPGSGAARLRVVATDSGPVFRPQR